MAFVKAAHAVTRATAVGSRAMRRIRADIWPLLQGTAAATTAWVIARDILGRPEPFFAPMAALIALNTSVGERGLNALRLLQGVFTGILVGEVTVATLGGGTVAIAAAILMATALARAMNGTRIVIAQAATGAILTVAVADADAGLERLTDALIGAGVALVFSQLIFSPEPLALLRRGERAVLGRIAAALTLTARSLAEHDNDLAEAALAEFRELPGDIIELRRLRRASGRVARRTLVGRSQRELVVRETEDADNLDLLGTSCQVLARVVPTLDADESKRLEPGVRELSEVVAALATDLGDRMTRQNAADRAVGVANDLADLDAESGSTLAAAATAIRLVSIDVMVFAGIESSAAVAAVREGIASRRVRAPAAGPRGLGARLRSSVRGLLPTWLRSR
jgi:uncharacterized membrane protein YgaE (UPF0421/DUF939 family)